MTTPADSVASVVMDTDNAQQNVDYEPTRWCHRSVPGRRGKDKLNVLYLTNQLPFPATSGGQVRESQLIQYLGGRVNIDLVVLTESFDRDFSHIDTALTYCLSVSVFESCAEPATKTIPKRVADYSSHTIGPELRKICDAIAYDVVHCEGYFLMRHLPKTDAAIVLVEENIEYQLETPDMVAEVKDQELAAWRCCDLVGAVSDADANVMRQELGDANVFVTRMGFDHLSAEATSEATMRDPGAVVFVGNFSWMPTRLGAEMLIRDVWPEVARNHDFARLTLVGSGADESLLALAMSADRVSLTGTVPSVRPYLETCEVFVSPVSLGSGVKVKMLEALSMGCAVIAHSASTFGLPDGLENVVILADEPMEMASAVCTLLGDDDRRRSLRSATINYVKRLSTWQTGAQDLLLAWSSAAQSRALMNGHATGMAR